MKKTLALFICGFVSAMLSSCVEINDDGLATVRIGYRYVESGNINHFTRSLIVPDIDKALSKIMPESIPLEITRDSLTKFYSLTGEEIVLPYNCHYKVSGRSEQTLTNLCDYSMYASFEPLIIIEDSIDVKYKVEEYYVNATIGSFVLAWNNNIVKSVMLDGLTTGKIPYTKVGSTSLCCITGEGEFNVTLVPFENESWKERTFTFTTYKYGNGIYCEPGKWYALMPCSNPETNAIINIECGDWICGGEYF